MFSLGLAIGISYESEEAEAAATVYWTDLNGDNILDLNGDPIEVIE